MVGTAPIESQGDLMRRASPGHLGVWLVAPRRLAIVRRAARARRRRVAVACTGRMAHRGQLHRERARRVDRQPAHFPVGRRTASVSAGRDDPFHSSDTDPRFIRHRLLSVRVSQSSSGRGPDFRWIDAHLGGGRGDWRLASDLTRLHHGAYCLRPAYARDRWAIDAPRRRPRSTIAFS
jgi:hypothetical protein